MKRWLETVCNLPPMEAMVWLALVCTLMTLAGLAFTAWMDGKPVLRYSVCHLKYGYRRAYMIGSPGTDKVCAEIMEPGSDQFMERMLNDPPWPLGYFLNHEWRQSLAK